MASPLESAWLYLLTHFSEFQLATFGTFIIHETVFFLSGLPSIFFEKFGLFSKYKIQAKNNTPEAHSRCILRLILYHVCVNLPVMIVSYPTFRFMGLKSSLPLPSWTVVLSQILFYFVIEDFVFYWGHRILHSKWLYKHVHSVHHEYATPFGLTSEYAHPAEILFLGFATVIGPVVTGPHLLTLWVWMILRVLETVEAHSGYHFPWSPSNFLPLYGGAEFHDYHHRVLYTMSGNYSSTFIYMDCKKINFFFGMFESPCILGLLEFLLILFSRECYNEECYNESGFEMPNECLNMKMRMLYGTDKGYRTLKALEKQEDKQS